jgi:hypothetical protein
VQQWHSARDTVITYKARIRLYRKPERTDVQKGHWAKQEGINGIRNPDLQKQLCLRKERTCSRNFRKTLELEVTIKKVRTSIRPCKMRDWILWRGWSPPKLKKRLHTD